MKNLKTKILIVIVMIILLQVTGCTSWKYYNWSRFQISEAGFSVQMPGDPRHFTMASSSSLDNEEYDQWTLIDSRTNQQFFIILAKYEPDKYQDATADFLLDHVDRPTVGFLDEAKELKSQRQIDNGYLMEEQEWQLGKRTNFARSRIYIFDGKIIELIHVYSISSKNEKIGDHFFESLEIE